MLTEQRDAIEQQEEIFGFLTQSRISSKNISRLEILAKSPNRRTAALAAIVLEVGKIAPYKRRRLKALAKQRRDLLRKLEETGLIYAHH